MLPDWVCVRQCELHQDSSQIKGSGGHGRCHCGAGRRRLALCGVKLGNRWELGTPELIGHRLQTSMTGATAEDRTAGLCKTLRTGRPLVVESE